VLEKVKGIEPCETDRRRFYMDRATFQKIESKFYMNNTNKSVWELYEIVNIFKF